MYFQANSQLCGCNGPGQITPAQLAPNCNCMTPGPCLNNVIACPQPYIGPQAVASPSIITSSTCPSPVVATTIIDNSVSNSLANALQLLIVSNLIENTLSAGVLPSTIAPVCDAILNSNSCNAVEYVTVSPNIMGPGVCEAPIIETLMPNICGCGDIGSIPGYTLNEFVSPVQQTFAPMCAGISPTVYGGLDCGIPTVAPVAAEVLFPSSIPAQLTCNFGYMNTNVPCVSVNVEPLGTFDSCSPNLFTNGYYY